MTINRPLKDYKTCPICEAKIIGLAQHIDRKHPKQFENILYSTVVTKEEHTSNIRS